MDLSKTDYVKMVTSQNLRRLPIHSVIIQHRPRGMWHAWLHN